MISILLIVATAFFVGLAVYAVRTLGVRRGRFLLGLLVWCIVSTFIFHAVRYPATAAIDLGAKIALLIDCVLLFVWRPGRGDPMPRA